MLWGSWGKIKVIWYMEGKSILPEVEREGDYEYGLLSPL